MAHGLTHGPVGGIVAAWPAVALVGSYELLMLIIRSAGQRPAGDQPGTVPSPVPTGAENAAMIALRATTAAGNALSQNQIMDRFGLTRAQAAKVRQRVAAESNGHPQEVSTGT